MKKFLISAMAMLFAVAVVQGQHTQFGLKAGLNSSSVSKSGGDDIDYGSELGFHVGGLAHIHLTDHFAVQPELVFSSQGGEKGNADLDLSYVNFPVLLQYMTNSGFRLQTGPQVGFLVSAKQDIGSLETDVDNYFSTVDFSWSFGASYLFPGGFGIDARYNHGINNISDDNSFEYRNRVLQLGVFYQFGHSTTARR